MLLRQMLYRSEIRFLSVIASYWLRLQSTPNYEELIRMLCERMLDTGTLRRFINKPENEDMAAGIRLLILSEGQSEAETFEDSMGPFRVAGMDKILREKMWLSPVSVTEKLWYRGIIYRENRIVGNELKDCYILPDDLLSKFSSIIQPEAYVQTKSMSPVLTVRPAIPSETANITAQDQNLPDVFCLAAALKRDEKPMVIPGIDMSESYKHFLEMLLRDSGFFAAETDADTEAIRSFMIQNRISAQIRLTDIWRHSADYCELSEIEELTVSRLPVFDHTVPREHVIRMVSCLEPDVWWSINGFLNAVKSSFPEFLRNTFSDDQWRILDKDGNDLNGISSWFQLEGAFLRFLILGPLQWLGIIRIAYTGKEETEAAAFRISKSGLFLLLESEKEQVSTEIMAKPNLEQDLPGISIDGIITCSSNVPRYFRYMCARYCDIESFSKHGTISFRITPSSLAGAAEKGLKCSSFLSMLKRFSRNKVPPALENMLSSADKMDPPAVIYNAVLLTIPDAGIFRELSETSRLEKWILQQINATTLIIDPKGIGDIRRFLMEKEIFVDIQI